MELERLQKVMAEAGIASRRASEKIILEGRVKVNGKIVRELGTKVSKNDLIEVDNKAIAKEEKAYFIMNKPSGFVTSLKDDNYKRKVKNLLGSDVLSKRVFPIEILDAEMAGALILTNDGSLAYALTRGYKEITKTFQVRVDSILSQDIVTKLMKGFMVKGKMTNRARIENIDFDREHQSTIFWLTIAVTKNKEVVDILEALGLKIKKIKLISFAGVGIDGLAEAEYRSLKPHEIKKLYSL